MVWMTKKEVVTKKVDKVHVLVFWIIAKRKKGLSGGPGYTCNFFHQY
jgi:hypothetical protein